MESTAATVLPQQLVGNYFTADFRLLWTKQTKLVCITVTHSYISVEVRVRLQHGVQRRACDMALV